VVFLIDENVDIEVGQFLAARGHTVHYVVQVLMPGAPDPMLAQWADVREAIIVTHNAKDFKILVSRVPHQGRSHIRNAGRLTLRCRESRAKARVEELIDSIEFEHAQTQKRKDKRFIAEVGDSKFNLVR
jgi:predicted nuclease of predicted toxin-antitoxin system